MKTLEFEWNGQMLHLCLNGAALFDIYEKYGTKGSITDPISGNGKKSFQATCWMLAKLAEQGNLVRIWQGHERVKVPTEQQLAALLSPVDVLAAKDAIRVAIELGFRMEADDGEREIDIGLQEIEKKTASG